LSCRQESNKRRRGEKNLCVFKRRGPGHFAEKREKLVGRREKKKGRENGPFHRNHKLLSAATFVVA